MKTIAIIFAFALSACVIEVPEDEEPGSEESEETYSNHVKLECNGSVLVDRTFTSRTACEDFRASNTFMCSGIKMTISC